MAELDGGARWVTVQHPQEQHLHGEQSRRTRLTQSRITCNERGRSRLPGHHTLYSTVDPQDSQGRGIDRTIDAQAQTLSRSLSHQAAETKVRASGQQACRAILRWASYLSAHPCPYQSTLFSTRFSPCLISTHLSQCASPRISICLSPSLWPCPPSPGSGFPISFGPLSSHFDKPSHGRGPARLKPAPPKKFPSRTGLAGC